MKQAALLLALTLTCIDLEEVVDLDGKEFLSLYLTKMRRRNVIRRF
jgi:hypothetical protein